MKNSNKYINKVPNQQTMSSIGGIKLRKEYEPEPKRQKM